jgi:hypothetical protein
LSTSQCREYFNVNQTVKCPIVFGLNGTPKNFGEKLMILLATLLLMAGFVSAQAPVGTANVSASNIAPVSMNGVLNATQFSGADIGAKVNAAIAAIITSYGGGTVYVPAGTYAITTPIVVPARVNLLGAGADSTQFNWAGVGAAIILSSVPHGGLDIATQVGGFVLTGTKSANQYGIYQGGDYTCTGGCTRNPSTNIGYDYSLHDISIYNMDYGIWWGNGVFNTRWDNVLVSTCTHYGWYYPVTSGFGGQNNHFYHSHLGGNLAGAFFVQQFPEVTFAMHGMDIEYNGNPSAPGVYQMQGGNYQCFDCHVEANFGPFVSVPSNSGSAAFFGGFFDLASSTAITEARLINLGTGRSTIVLDGVGLEIHHTVTNLIIQSEGGNQPQIYFHNNSLVDTGGFLRAVTNVTGQGVSWCLPWNPSGGGNGSCYDGNIYTNPMGTIANNPPLRSLPASGNYLGWNSTGQGNSDFINTFNGSSSTNTAHRWLVNNGGTFVEVGRIDRDGSFVSPGKNSASGYSITGGAAWTSGAVDPKGSCVGGSMYSNTAGVSGHAFWTCVSGIWVDVK